MKAIFTCLILGFSVAQASVDYVAIGTLLKNGKKEIASAKDGVACIMKDYAQSPTCIKIEEINKETNKLLSTKRVEIFNVYCGGHTYFVSSANYLQNQYLNEAKELAKEAEANDPVHGVIQNVETSLNQLVAETKEILAKAKLQETYVTQCLLGQEPPSESILEQLCK